MSGAGAKALLFSTLQAILDPGDEAVIPTPAYPAFQGMTITLGAIPVMAPCTHDSGFKLTSEMLAAAITPATRVVFLNSPNNPSGAVYSAAELRSLADVLVNVVPSKIRFS